MNTSDNKSVQDDDLKNQVIKSLVWLGGMKYVGQIYSWAITILVIRILNPGDYGLMSMASVCINFLVMISELGLGAAIVQKKEIDKDTLSQVLGFILLSHGVLFCCLFFGSPLIADFFSEPRLTLILQVLSINFISLALYVIPRSVLMREMEFKKRSVVDLIGTVVSVTITLGMAIYGYGVWSLVWASLVNNGIQMIGYNLLAPVFLLPKFRLRGIQEIISFGAYTLGSRILWYFYSRADIFIGGRILGNQLLGVYSVALELSQIPMDKFMPIVNQVAFPAYARIQSDLELVRSHFLKSARIASLLLFPAFWGLFVIAPELMDWLLGDKWTGVVLPLQIMCVIMPFIALGTLISPMLYGIGRVDIAFLYVAVASVLMPLSFLIGSHYYGVEGLCIAWVCGYSLVFFVTLKLSLRLIDLSILKFLSDISVAPIASIGMNILLFVVKYLLRPYLSLPLTACLSVFIGIGIYCFLVFLLKKAVFRELWSLIPGTDRFEAFVKRRVA